jgi:hypothetical protein
MVVCCVGQDIGIALDHEAGCFGCFNRQRFFDSVQRCIIGPGYSDVIEANATSGPRPLYKS